MKRSVDFESKLELYGKFFAMFLKLEVTKILVAFFDCDNISWPIIDRFLTTRLKWCLSLHSIQPGNNPRNNLHSAYVL